MTKQYREKKRWICVILCLIICVSSGIKIQAAQPGYFDDPEAIYEQFQGKIYDASFKRQYAF